MTTFTPNDRNYTSWDTGENNMAIDPIKDKLLVGDTFDETGVQKISTYRQEQSIPGILVYDGRTFGRHSNGKSLYKCVPNDKQLPVFLVSYAPKSTTFSKKKVNKYILFKFCEWTDTQKHPIAMLTNTLGNVDEFNVYCSYQLYCRNVHISTQRFTKQTSEAVFKYDDPEQMIDYVKLLVPNFEDRTDMNIIAIDPLGSSDFDDALGIIELADNTHIISVYISNVIVWLEALNLFDSFTDRITSIYLPDTKRGMLPNILSDIFCSLVQDYKSMALAMDITLNENYEIESIDFKSCLISVTKNYVYDSDEMLKDPSYAALKNCCTNMRTHYPYLENIDNSHDVVAYFMILMNHRCGKYLSSQQTGIFRNATLTQSVNTSDVPSEIKQFVSYWKQTGGSYSAWSDMTGHDMIGEGLECYAQITSPIRRVVDLINIALLQEKQGLLTLSDKAKEFIDKWMNDIKTINTFTKNVKRVQNECNLLHRSLLPAKQKELLTGYVVDILGENKYMIYVPSISMKTRVVSEDNWVLYQKHKFILYAFMDEATLQRKVRLQVSV